MRVCNILKAVLASLIVLPVANADLLKYMDDCNNHCRKTHTKYGNTTESENNATKVKHTAEDIVLTSCLQRCRLSEIIRPKATIEAGHI